MSSEKIGVCAQTRLTIQSSIVNIIGGDLYDHLMTIGLIILITSKIFIRAPKIYEEIIYGPDLNLLTILY